MTDEELLDWYKNGATKPTDMSDKDYELTMNKALAASKNQMLDSNLAAQQGAIAKAQTNAQQSASISNDKLLKYLGQKQLASGVATGQTGSDFINANNAYTQNRSAISNEATAQQTDLLRSYAGEKLQSDSDTFNKETSILDKYRTLEREDEQIEYNRSQDELAQENWLKQFGLSLEQFEEEKKNNAFNQDLTLEQWAYSKWRDEVGDERYEEELGRSLASDEYAHASELFSMYLDDYTSDGNFTDDEYEAAKQLLEKYALGDNKQKLTEYLDYYKSSYGEGGVNNSSDGSSSDTKLLKNYTAGSDELSKYIQQIESEFQSKNTRKSASEYFNDAVNGAGSDTQEQSAAVRGALAEISANPNWKPQKYDDLKDFSMEELWKYVDNKGDPKGYKATYGADKGEVYYAEMFAYLMLKQKGYVN
jgi:hypothetical protein